jgi:hypothetical protein
METVCAFETSVISKKIVFPEYHSRNTTAVSANARVFSYWLFDLFPAGEKQNYMESELLWEQTNKRRPCALSWITSRPMPSPQRIRGCCSFTAECCSRPSLAYVNNACDSGIQRDTALCTCSLYVSRLLATRFVQPVSRLLFSCILTFKYPSQSVT